MTKIYIFENFKTQVVAFWLSAENLLEGGSFGGDLVRLIVHRMTLPLPCQQFPLSFFIESFSKHVLEC